MAVYMGGEDKPGFLFSVCIDQLKPQPFAGGRDVMYPAGKLALVTGFNRTNTSHS